jgi:hypothetical protein
MIKCPIVSVLLIKSNISLKMIKQTSNLLLALFLPLLFAKSRLVQRSSSSFGPICLSSYHRLQSRSCFYNHRFIASVFERKFAMFPLFSLVCNHQRFYSTSLHYVNYVNCNSSIRFYSTDNSSHVNDNSTNLAVCKVFSNEVIVKLKEKCKTLYDKFTPESVLKRKDSLVAYIMNLSDKDVIEILYELNSNKGIKHYFYKPDNFNVPGIYCFLSKDGSHYYIGSSMNMKIRYNRHMFNLKHSNVRYSQANPKFYNYIKKYGLEKLDFGCLLVIKNYLTMYSAFNLSEEEIFF